VTDQPDAITYLIRLRAAVVRMAHEVEGATDDFTGKKARIVRERTRDIARRMRDAAMEPDLHELCHRRRLP